jgi:hypothetical protein
LVSVARDSFKFSWHEIKHKKKEKEIAFEYWFVDEDKKVWEADMEKHDEYPISKASFYNYRDKLIKKNKQQKTNEEAPF